MQEFFGDRQVSCSITGKTNETIVFKRKGKSNSRFTENYLYEGLLEDTTALTCGDIVTAGTDIFFVIARRNGYLSKVAQLQKANCTIDVWSVTGSISSGFSGVQVSTGNPASQTTVSDTMKQYDAGLLKETVKKLLLPKIVIKCNDRIVLNGINYWVTAVDDGTYEGLYSVQVKPDTRSLK